MKFAAIFLGLSAFILSIEPIRSQQKPDRATFTKLEKLFPQSDGGHFPPIERIDEEIAASIPKFRILDGKPIKEKKTTNFLKRGDFIFAFEQHNMVRILTEAFCEPLHIYPVFDMKNQKWYTLHIGELQQLGVGRYFPYVRAVDEAHALQHEHNHRVNLEAHNAAKKVAYFKTKKYEQFLDEPSSNDSKNAPALLKQYYLRTYEEEYERLAGGPSGGR